MHFCRIFAKAKMKKTAIIVPCYNEAARLDRGAFLDFVKESRDCDVIFVNDGSADATAAILSGLCGASPDQMTYISLKENSGKAEAVRQGFLWALRKDYSFIGYWDADLATPLADVKKFTSLLEGRRIDLVMGSRVNLLGRDIQRKATRHYLGRVFATLTSLTLQIPVYDTQCGAKIFRANSTLKRAFSIPFTVNWTFDVELLARIALIERGNGNPNPSAKWLEFPLEKWTDIAGSKVRGMDFLRGAIELTRIFMLLHFPWIKKSYRKRLKGGE